MDISVIVCTHNPQYDYLTRVLSALAEQTLPANRWELLLIDNCSSNGVLERPDLTLPDNARRLAENELGLTPARLAGIRETQSPILVFVDDDNVLDTDYLDRVLVISSKHPELGAWGGRITPEFEESPPPWIQPYVGALAIRVFERDSWACCWPPPDYTMPCGAGMVVRRQVADSYSVLAFSDPRRRHFGRKGSALTSCEDSDIALTAWSCGLGTGCFVDLHVTHLIPSARLKQCYIASLIEATAYSGVFLRHAWNLPLPSGNVYNRVYHFLRALRRNGFARMAYYAEQRGIRHALRELRMLKDLPPTVS